jgi:two-component system, OmpR family, KDP operon response regulator KdpE
VLGYTAMDSPRRVLVVDDEPRILRLASISLSMAGYEVITTARGEDVISLVQSENPDIVLLDVVMDPVDGLTILKRLRAFSQIPVLLFTARTYADEQVRIFGANGVVSKPFRPDELAKAIKITLNNG